MNDWIYNIEHLEHRMYNMYIEVSHVHCEATSGPNMISRPAVHFLIFSDSKMFSYMKLLYVL